MRVEHVRVSPRRPCLALASASLAAVTDSGARAPSATGGYGELQWESNGGDITPHLTGYLWTQNLAATCAKMRIQYYAEAANGDYVHLATRGSPEHCPTTDTIEWTEVDMAPFSDPSIVRVVVSTTVENALGQFSIVGSQGFNLGD